MGRMVRADSRPPIRIPFFAKKKFSNLRTNLEQADVVVDVGRVVVLVGQDLGHAYPLFDTLAHVQLKVGVVLST